VNFAHGLPIWSISIALEDAGRSRWASSRRPARLVVRGEPRRRRARRERCRAARQLDARLDHALLTTGFPYDLATRRDNNLAEWEHLQRAPEPAAGSARPRSIFAGRQRLDGRLLERHLKSWDLRRLADRRRGGGIVTNWTGGRFDVHEAEVVASNVLS